MLITNSLSNLKPMFPQRETNLPSICAYVWILMLSCVKPRSTRVKSRVDSTAVIQRDVSPNIPAGRLQLRELRVALMTRDVNSATAADVLRREIVLYDSLPSLYVQTRRNAIVTSRTTWHRATSRCRGSASPRGYIIPRDLLLQAEQMSPSLAVSLMAEARMFMRNGLQSGAILEEMDHYG